MDEVGSGAEGATNGVAGGGDASMVCQPSSSVIINIPPPSPRSPRLAHLRPPSPLTPEAMRRINLLTVQEGAMDASKLSPISPLYPTSDLGSSPRSSISVTTSSSSSAWSAFREHKKSSSDFTDADSDCCKDLFSPSIMLSPAPFSPFSDHPDIVETPAFSDPTSTPMGQRLRFTFDPKSPSFLPLAPSRSSHFLLPPAPALGVVRERSRSDSDTNTALDSSTEDSSPGQEQVANNGAASSAQTQVTAASKSTPRRQVEGGHKHLYKKRLLRKYTEETCADSVSISLENAKVSDGPASGGSTSSSCPQSAQISTIVTVSSADDEPSAPKSGRSTLLEGMPNSPMPNIVRQDPPASVTSLTISSLATMSSPSAPVSPTFRPSSSLGLATSASSSRIGTLAAPSTSIPKSASASSQSLSPNPNLNSNVAAQRSIESASLPLIRLGAANLSNQSYFDMWLKQQLMAVNTLWYPPEQNPTPATVSNSQTSGVSVLSPPRPFFGPFPNSGTIYSSSQHSQSKPSPTTPAMETTPSQAYPSMGNAEAAAPRRPPHTSNAAPPPALGPIKSRRSRSESDVSYVCQYCGQSFSLHDRLAKHVASRHRDRSSSSESPLKSHKCGVCHKAFGRSDMLTRHMRLHTGIKPYACRVCGQVFSRSDHLSTHHRTHTGEKPYQCPQCPYAASRRDMITRHMRTHSRSGYTEHSSSSPSSSSSSTSGALAGGTLDEASTSVGYVSVIRRALDHTLLLDPPLAPDTGGDLEETGSQLTTPRMSADSSGRASTGSMSTVLCAEDEEDMMCQSADEDKEAIVDSACKSSILATRAVAANDFISSVHTSPSIVVMANGRGSSPRSVDIVEAEMTVKIESPG